MPLSGLPVGFDRDNFEAISRAAFATGSRGRIVAWNSKAAALLRIRADAACGRPCAQLLEGRTLRGATVCTRSCPLVTRLAEWMGDPSHSGRRDWRPDPSPSPGPGSASIS